MLGFFFDQTLKERDNLLIINDDMKFVKSERFKGVVSVIDLVVLSNNPAGEIDPVNMWSINYLGGLRVAALARRMGVKRYILPSSCNVYGFTDETVVENSP